MEDRKKILTIISLGAGVQSSTMAIMAAKGDLPMPQGSIFSDTQNEPRRVYDYLKYLKSILPYPVHIVTKGHIIKYCVFIFIYIKQKRFSFCAVIVESKLANVHWIRICWKLR